MLDKNEIEVLQESKENGTELNIYLDNRICLRSKILEVSDDEIMIQNKEGMPTVQSLDTVSAIVFWALIMNMKKSTYYVDFFVI